MHRSILCIKGVTTKSIKARVEGLNKFEKIVARKQFSPREPETTALVKVPASPNP
jgi:hypothetical protein